MFTKKNSYRIHVFTDLPVAVFNHKWGPVLSENKEEHCAVLNHSSDSFWWTPQKCSSNHQTICVKGMLFPGVYCVKGTICICFNKLLMYNRNVWVLVFVFNPLKSKGKCPKFCRTCMYMKIFCVKLVI